MKEFECDEQQTGNDGGSQILISTAEIFPHLPNGFAILLQRELMVRRHMILH